MTRIIQYSFTTALMITLACSSSGKVTDTDRTPSSASGVVGHEPTVAKTNDSASNSKRKSKEITVPAIEMKFISQKRIHPPMSELTFDAVLRNHADRARWFLLPAELKVPPAPVDSTIFGVDVFALSGTGKSGKSGKTGDVVLGEFQGVPGFFALQLSAGAEVTLRGLTVALAGDMPPSPVSLQAVICDSATIGGEAIETWFKGVPATLSGTKADVSRQGAEPVGSRETPDLAGVPVSLVGVERIDVNVPTK